MTNIFTAISDLPPEQRAIRDKCFHPTGKFTEFKKEEIEQSIPDRFEQQVAKYPHRIAVNSRKHTFTYEALNRFANRIAWAILQQCGEEQKPIALFLENDAAMTAAILGVMKAGKMYVVLDPSFPRARIGYMLEDSRAGLLLTDRKDLSSARKLAHDECRLIDIEELDASLSIENPALSISPDDFTYMVYTSGSTGQPKGVLQNHRNGLHEAMLYANGLHISPEDRLALLYSCSASQGMKITFGALLNGAALCVFNLQREGVSNLAGWLIQEKITIYFSIPIVFRQFVSTFTGQEKFPKLRLIQLGSDSVTPREVEEYKTYFSANTTLVVRLGTTETGTLRTCFFDRTAPLAEKMVPVGYAIEDMEVSLLDEEGQKVDFCRVGEIAVKSRYLSPGYWRRADLTRDKFLPGPDRGDKVTFLTGDLGRMLPDGCLYHLGRKDFQVKIRGHRIEVTEIELALLSLPSIKEAVVTASEDQPSDQRLVAYLVLNGRPASSVSKLRTFLKDRLPDYMVPSAFVFLDALPLAPNGKLDREALPAPDWSRPDLKRSFVAPRNSLEQLLASIWTEVLKLEQIGVYDNFFELGGHSLLATQVISRVRETFQVEVPLRTLFEMPTIEELAEVIIQSQAKGTEQED